MSEDFWLNVPIIAYLPAEFFLAFAGYLDGLLINMMPADQLQKIHLSSPCLKENRPDRPRPGR